MLKHYKIKEIKIDELPPLLKLYKCLPKKNNPATGKPKLNNAWNEICQDKKVNCFGIYDKSRLISTCILTIIPNITHGARPYALIENVVTHPDYRRKGLGTAVLRYAQNYAWQHDCYKVMLLTGKKDAGTLTFYKKAGFKQGIKTGFISYPDII